LVLLDALDNGVEAVVGLCGGCVVTVSLMRFFSVTAGDFDFFDELVLDNVVDDSLQVEVVGFIVDKCFNTQVLVDIATLPSAQLSLLLNWENDLL